MGTLNLQDLEMTDQKGAKIEKAGLENDGSNRRSGKCRTWQMTVRHFPGPAFTVLHFSVDRNAVTAK